jgi:hypothetical protein
MRGYEVARMDETDEVTDGHEPLRPIRHHVDITSFGTNGCRYRLHSMFLIDYATI